MRAGFQAKDPRQKAQMTGQKRNRNHLCSLVILALLLVATGCKSGPEPAAEPTPGWIESIPKDDTHYYALGVSGPTPRIADAWDQAIRRALAELGRMIISHISSRDTIISISSGQYAREIVKILPETGLSYTEVVERWADRFGVYGPAEHFYVPVRIEKKRAESVLRSIKERASEGGIRGVIGVCEK